MKNKDPQNDFVVGLITKSTNPLVASLFSGYISSEQGRVHGIRLPYVYVYWLGQCWCLIESCVSAAGKKKGGGMFQTVAQLHKVCYSVKDNWVLVHIELIVCLLARNH